MGLQLGYFEVGLALCFGAFWSSPSDVSGSFQHKKIGILISAALVMVVSFIGGYLHYETWLSLPVLGILSFGIAYISIYGFRASLISFSGLLAMVLSLAHESEELEIYQYAILIGVGGLWYLFLAKIWRILDTMVGAGLSYAAMWWLWPTWEFVEIKESMAKSVKANTDFLHKITEYYQQKGNVSIAYKIARKQAYLETSNLSSAFQRMAQEPRSKQKEIDKVYELVALNHTSLASLASLSIFIQHHETTEASEEFKLVTAKIEKNLESVLQCLNGKTCEGVELSYIDNSFFEEQLHLFHSLDIENFTSKNNETVHNLQESHLVWEQLEWMFTISDKMFQLTASLKLN